MGNTSPIRVSKEFKDDIWEKIREKEASRLDRDVKEIKDPQVSRALRKRIIDAGGIK